MHWASETQLNVNSAARGYKEPGQIELTVQRGKYLLKNALRLDLGHVHVILVGLDVGLTYRCPRTLRRQFVVTRSSLSEESHEIHVWLVQTLFVN